MSELTDYVAVCQQDPEQLSKQELRRRLHPRSVEYSDYLAQLHTVWLLDEIIDKYDNGLMTIFKNEVRFAIKAIAPLKGNPYATILAMLDKARTEKQLNRLTQRLYDIMRPHSHSNLADYQPFALTLTQDTELRLNSLVERDQPCPFFTQLSGVISELISNVQLELDLRAAL